MERIFDLDFTTVQLKKGGSCIIAEFDDVVIKFYDYYYELALVAKFADGYVMVWDDYYDSFSDNSNTLIWGTVDDDSTVTAEIVHHSFKRHTRPMTSCILPHGVGLRLNPIKMDVACWTDPEVMFERVAEIAETISIRFPSYP